MNASFYTAIDHLPLGTVAAIEFLPVIGLAALGMRTARNGAALGVAACGVYAVTDVHLGGTPFGVALAFANAALFAGYIVLAHRIARSPGIAGIDGLAGAMLAAAVAITPAAPAAAHAFTDPALLLAGIGVGVTSSVIPYICDQLAMARLPRATYALLVSLLPATATAIGDRRPRSDPHAGRRRRRGPRDRRRGAPPRALNGPRGATITRDDAWEEDLARRGPDAGDRRRRQRSCTSRTARRRARRRSSPWPRSRST